MKGPEISLDDQEHGRIVLLYPIINKLYHNRWSAPSASEERSYNESLAHLSRICSNNTEMQPQGTILNRDLMGCSKNSSRKLLLKEILVTLQLLERNRLYDPPEDNEIPYYLLIKRYIRCLIAFTHATKPDFQIEKIFGYYRRYFALGPVQELVELNWQLADLSTFVSEKDISNGSSFKQWMDINNKELPPVISGSKDRSNNMFYHHKFMLALLDLRSSEFLYCPASADEKRSYVQASDGLQWNFCITGIEKMDIYSDQLAYLFCERIHHESDDFARHFTRIVRSILEKLCISEYWESLEKIFVYVPFVYDGDSKSFVDFGKELAEKLDVSIEDLPDYITSLDKCLFLASTIYSFFSSHCESVESIYWLIHRANLPGLPHRGQLGWEALHVLTLLKRGSLSNGNIYREQPTLQNDKKVSEELLYDANKDKCSSREQEQNGNIKILKGIIENLRIIGHSDFQPDDEECQLISKIWQNVAASVHFYLCAMAYEQKRLIMESVVPLSASMFGVRTATRKKNRLPGDKLVFKSFKLEHNVNNFKIFLDSYKNSLLQKLENLKEKQI